MANIVTHLGQNFNWIAYKNGHNTYTITFTSGGSAFDISSYVFVVNIRASGGSTNKLQLTEASGITNGGATGILTIDLTKTQAQTTLPRDLYFYEIAYTKTSKVYALIQGNLSLSSESNPGSTTTSVSMSVSLAGTAISAAITLPGTDMTAAEIATALGTQDANVVYAGPSSGADAVPAFRALVGADIPAIGRVFTTSGVGAVDDADVSLASATFGTDNYTALQALLDLAEDGPITIIWDGQYSVNQYLEVWANTHIIGLPGCGVILRDDAPGGLGTSGTILRNKNIVVSSSVGGYGSNIVDENIIIENLIINGNSPGQNWVNHAILFRGVRNLEISNCKMYAGDRFMTNFNNIENIRLVNNIIDHGVEATSNHDGFHFDGYNRYISIDGLVVRNCDDDVIALLPGTINAQGPITDVDIRNITLDNAGGGIRLGHGLTGFYIERVNIDGVRGSTTTAAIRFHTFDGTTAYCENVTIKNIDVEVSSGSIIQIPSTGTYRNIDISGIFRNADSANAVPLINITGSAIINNLKLDGFSGRFDAATPVISMTAGTIHRLQISNAFYLDTTGANLDLPLIYLNGGQINTIQLSNIATQFVNRLIDLNAGTVNEIQATNIYLDGIVTAFHTNITVADLMLSNFKGEGVSTIVGGTGAFTTKRGSALDYLGVFTVSTAPTAATYPGAEISVGDETGGYVRAFSDGTNWLRVTDGAIIS